jgi:hypothetical protein
VNKGKKKDRGSLPRPSLQRVVLLFGARERPPIRNAVVHLVVGKAGLVGTVQVHLVKLVVAACGQVNITTGEGDLLAVWRVVGIDVRFAVAGELLDARAVGFIVKISKSPSGLVFSGVFRLLWNTILPFWPGNAASAGCASTTTISTTNPTATSAPATAATTTERARPINTIFSVFLL